MQSQFLLGNYEQVCKILALQLAWNFRVWISCGFHTAVSRLFDRNFIHKESYKAMHTQDVLSNDSKLFLKNNKY